MVNATALAMRDSRVRMNTVLEAGRTDRAQSYERQQQQQQVVAKTVIGRQ